MPKQYSPHPAEISDTLEKTLAAFGSDKRRDGAAKDTSIIIKLMIHVCQQKCTIPGLVMTKWVTANPVAFINMGQYLFY